MDLLYDPVLVNLLNNSDCFVYSSRLNFVEETNPKQLKNLHNLLLLLIVLLRKLTLIFMSYGWTVYWFYYNPVVLVDWLWGNCILSKFCLILVVFFQREILNKNTRLVSWRVVLSLNLKRSFFDLG